MDNKGCLRRRSWVRSYSLYIETGSEGQGDNKNVCCLLQPTVEMHMTELAEFYMYKPKDQMLVKPFTSILLLKFHLKDIIDFVLKWENIKINESPNIICI